MKNIQLALLVTLIWACTDRKFQYSYQPELTLPIGYEWPKNETFKVLSWNVEHFVDPFDDPYINNRREDYPDSSMTPKKIEGLLRSIEIANADIVVLQEFESARYLERLIRDSLPKLAYQFFSDAPSRSWYMNVAVASRFPLGVTNGYHEIYTPVEDWVNDNGETETQRNINTRMWSSEVFFSPDASFMLTGLHLKAGRGDRNIGMRKGQIRFLQSQFERFYNEKSDRGILVVGDLNALPNSDELQLFKSATIKGIALIDPLDSAVFTHPADNPQRRLDYMLPNPTMYEKLVKGSVEVSYLLDTAAMREVSDHLPVLATFMK